MMSESEIRNALQNKADLWKVTDLDTQIRSFKQQISELERTVFCSF